MSAKFFKAAFFVLLCLFPFGRAFAHATPFSYQPEASSVVLKAPVEVRIRFSERLEAKAGSIFVFAPDGSRADNNDAHVDSKDNRLFVVGLKNAGEGSYAVSWQVVSADDGHFTKGAFVFSVGQTSVNAASVSQSVEVRHISSVPEGLTVGIELLGEALALGVLLVIVFIWRPARRKYFSAELELTEGLLQKRLSFALVAATLLVLGGGIVYFILKTNQLAELQQSTISHTFWLFFSTVSAKYTFYRMLAIITFFLVFWSARKKILLNEKISKTEVFLFLLLAFVALARARVSHAAASAFYPELSIFINFVHLYFKDLWIGGVLALLILLSPVVGKLKNAKISLFILTSFSKIVAISLAVSGVTGVYVIWLHLKSFGNVLSTSWGEKFIILSIFAAALFAARILSQLWLKKKVIASWLPIILSFEAGMGIFILLVTGNLIITTPPIAPHYSFLKQQQSQGINISLTQHPYELSKFLVTLTSANSKTSPDIHKLTITLTNSEKNIGPVIVPIEQRFLGGFVFDQELLSPQGVWKIDITAQRPSAYDAVASFAVNYPGEIDFAKAHSQDRSFDRFEMINIFIALLILLTAVFLYRHGDRLNELSGQPQTITSNPTPISLLYDRGAWSVPLVFGLFVLSFLGGRHNVTLFKSDFQILCEKNANQTFFVWHENVPQRAGQATSDIAVPGCMVGNGLGQYHFADIREFLYFIRPVQAQAGLSIEPKEFEAGKPAILVFNIRDFTGQPVGELNLDHDRILHAVVVSEDFSVFSHLHVEDLNPVSEEMIKQGKFPISYVFPKAGKYLVAVDFTVRSKLFVESFFVNVGGLSLQANLQKDFSLSKNFNSYQVALKTSPAKIKSGEEIILQYNIKKADNPVTDLQAYLNSPMHISIIKEDLSKFMHTHGWLPKSGLNKILGTGIHTQHLFLPEKFGPNIESRLTFPGPGAYHIFGEFKHNGKVVPTHFMLKAE